MSKVENSVKMSENPPEPSRSCVEITSMIYAIFSSIITGLSCAASYIGLFVIVVLLFTNNFGPYHYEGYAFTAISVAAVTVSSIAFSFSVVLTIGLFKKKTDFIRAYCIYRIVVLILTVTVIVILLLLYAGEVPLEMLLYMGLVAFGSCMLYSVILGIIWTAYKKIKMENMYKHHMLNEANAKTEKSFYNV